MLDLSGKILVFVNEKDCENDRGVAMTRNVYCTSFSKQDEEQESGYINAYMDVIFSNNLKEAFKLDKKGEGDILEVTLNEAWLSFRAWEDKDGKQRRAFYIFVNDADIDDYVKEEKQTKKATNKKSVKTTSKKK